MPEVAGREERIAHLGGADRCSDASTNGTTHETVAAWEVTR
jgi:hypothetical protein